MRDKDIANIQTQDTLIKEIMKEYWIKVLSGDLAKTTLPMFDLSKSKGVEEERRTLEFLIPDNLYNRIMTICNHSHMGFFVFLAAALNALLYKYSRNENIIIGTAGFTINKGKEIDPNNILILKNHVSGELSFKELLKVVKGVVLDACKYQEYPFEEIEEWLRANRKLDFKDILHIAFISEQVQAQPDRLKEFYLVIRCCPRDQKEEQNYFSFGYNPNIYHDIIVRQFALHFINFLTRVLEAVETCIEEIEILSEEDRQVLLHSFNTVERKRTLGDSEDTELLMIQELFEQQVERTPDGLAVIWAEQLQVTYDELNKRANQLACKLREKGVKPGAIVALMLVPSIEMVIGMLGVLKSGGAYLPIDTDYPVKRREYMIRDSHVGMILVHRCLPPDGVIDMRVDVIYVDIDDDIEDEAGSNPVIVNKPNDPAYVNYTSGSTGKPKGVIVEHRNVIAYLEAFLNEFDIDSEDIVLQQASYSFDVIVEEVYPLLLKGGRLVIPSENEMNNIDCLTRFITRNNITFISCSPVLLSELNQRNFKNRIHTFINGGDVLRPKHIDKLLDIGNVYNTYGPTETTVCAAYYRCNNDKNLNFAIPIGRPILNYNIYIVDAGNRFMPIGVPGELCIAGEGVSRGYLNHPELTAEKFLSISYKSYRTYISKKIYKTGDLARWQPDRNIQFLGRIDFQVKIRGYRVELEEVEYQLCTHPLVNEAVVLAGENDSGDKYLCAYIESDEGLKDKESDLRDYLSRILPDYMIPSSIVELDHDHIPRTTTGKVDRKSLLEIEAQRCETPYIAPANEVEEKLTEIWADLLNLENEVIGINRNFFELGGHSLKATVMISRIHKSFDVTMQLIEIFRKPTIKGLAEYIKNASKDKCDSLEVAEKKEYYVLSSAQKRIYILQQMNLESTGYSMPLLEVLESDIDREELETIFKKIIQRHESLRTSFHMVEEAPVQRVHDPDEEEFEIEYFSVEPGAESTLYADIIRSFIRSFDLSNAPLLRVRLIKQEEKRYILMVDMHHIISDGQSLRLIVEDFKALYDGLELPRIPLQYKDYAEWQNRVEQRAALESQETYWLKEFRGEIPVLNLPTDFARPAVQGSEGHVIHFELGESETMSLHNLARSHDLTPYMVLLTVYYVLLSKLSAQQDIVVGTPVLGRRHADLENIIGMFVNTLPLKNDAAPGKRFKDFLEEVGEGALSAFENQEYPFEELVEKLAVERNTSRNPLFDTMFALADGTREQSNRKDYQYNDLAKTSKFDLTLMGSDRGGTLSFAFEYSTNLFKQEKIERFAAYFKTIISSVLENEAQQIAGIDMLSREEKHRLLVNFSNAEAEYLQYKPISQLLEEQVNRTPGKVAVVTKSCLQVTYRELNERANELADIIRTSAGENNCIGIMFDDNPYLLTVIFAVIKSGNWFVPIAPTYPDDRIHFVVNDCGIKLLLTDKANHEKARAVVDRVPSQKDLICVSIDIDIEINHAVVYEDSDRHKHENENRIYREGYIIYTSGSTGRPKGVLITQENLVPLLVWFRDYFRLGEDTRVLQSLSYSFDFGVFEILTTVLFGGTLYQGSRGELLNLTDYAEFIDLHGIDTIHTTPSFFNHVVSLGIKMPGLKIVHLGGEILTDNMVIELSKLVSPDCMIYNGYGPTEASVNSSIFALRAGDAGELTTGGLQTIPIGKPSANNIIYILDKFNNLQPVEVAGELCVSGRGVSMGYLNRPELTAEKFLSISYKSYRSYRTYISKKFYKTGDLARWLADGNIEFLGRIDQQVKIRGFRIELGEIENRLLEMALVKKAVVIDRETNGEKYLCAYIVLGGGSDREPTAAAEELRKYLSLRLPNYMIPSYFMPLEKLPLTPTGKTDRNALPEPESVVETEYAPPGNEIEEQLADIWSEVLDIAHRPIGINENFFELGGHSLKATILAAKIHKVFDIKVPLIEIFKVPTIKGLFRYISDGTKEKYLSIEPAEEKEYYVLSSAQKRIYILQQMDLESSGYSMLVIEVLESDIDREKLETIFKKIIQRHESLRTSFHMVEEAPVQRVHDPDEKEFEIEYFSLEPGAESPLYADIIQGFIRPFDLSNAPLLRVRLIKQEEKRYILMVDMHHIISDGQSMRLIVEDFKALYDGGKLPRLRLQYKDYAEWQNRVEQRAALESQEKYWLKEFRGEIPVLNLPTDFARPAVQRFEGHVIHFELGESETMSLHNLARSHDLTPYMVLLTVYYVLLSKLSAQQDIVVGTPVLGRRHADLENIIGMFVNTLPLKNDAVPGKRFKDFLEEVGERALSAFENQEYPFEELVEKLAVERNTSRNPLFDTMFALADGTREQNNRKDYQYNDLAKTSKFDLTLMGSDQGGTLSFVFEYSTNLFKQEKIERFAAYFKTIISSVLKNEAQQIAGIDMLSQEEKQRLLVNFSNAEAEYLPYKSINELLEEQVSRTPGKVAVAAKSYLQVTYRRLNEGANKLADIIRTAAGQANCVGIMFDDNPYLVTAIFAVVKSGNWFVPIAPTYPDDRIHFVVNDCGITLLLTDKANQEKARAVVDRVPSQKDLICVCIDIDIEINHAVVYEDSDRYKHENENRIYREGYIIYTSGSTGRPKGVLITQENLVPLLVWFRDYFRLGEDTQVLQSLSYSFDFGVFEILTTVLFGGTLYQGSREELLNLTEYVEFIYVHGINTIHTTPSFFNHVVLLGIKMPGLKIVHLGGEVLTANMVVELSRLVSPDCMIYNGYGPTEASVNSSIFALRAGDAADITTGGMQAIPIGKPSANNIIYILDKFNNLQPVEVAGELCVSGRGVSMGYLNRPELTAEHFIHLTLNTQHLTLYKTGDLARWLADGNIEFLGRIDQQVKIRGFRIEPGEIENRLLEMALVKKAVVIDRETNGEKYLCAYIVLAERSDSEPTAVYEELRKHLSRGLPDYMVPSYFMLLEKLPLTPTGKTDRKALPEPEAVVGTEYVPPGNEIEGQLEDIWSEVLGVIHRPIGIYDNFFELGGHSLKATVLAAKIHKVFDIKVPLIEIFKVPTIKGLFKYISDATKEKYLSIEPAEAKEYYVLSSAQKRIYILQQMDLESSGYNMPLLEVLESDIDREKLEKKFREIIARHESLLTSFHLVEDAPVQWVHDPDDVEFEIEYFHVKPGAKSPLNADIIRSFIRPFDLSNAPLLRVRLIKQEETRYILMVDMHHIISDGHSLRLIVEDFETLYDGLELPRMRLQYKDYAEWQNRVEQRAALESQETYWLKEFRGEIPVLNLPTDFARPAVQRFEGHVIHFELGESETISLHNLARSHDLTPYMVLLTIYYVLLSKLSVQQDIVVGTPVLGRRHADLENIIGMFVNTLPLRNDPVPGKRFKDFLEEVGERALSAFENQEYPFEELVEKLAVERNTSRNPLFDTMFALADGIREPNNRKDYQYNDLAETSKFDLTLMGSDRGGTLSFVFEYSTNLFKQEKIERFAAYFRTIIASVLENEDQQISRIEMLSREEKHRLLVNFSNAEAEYLPFKPISQLLEEQVSRTPGKVAVVSKSCLQVTYRELNERANELADMIRTSAGENNCIGIMFDDNPYLVTAIFAVVKSGNWFVPIAPNYPDERIHFVVNDCGIKLLLTDKANHEKGRDIVDRVPYQKDLICVCIDIDIEINHAVVYEDCDRHKDENENRIYREGYIIYTSGSTGRPKGVLITQENLVPLLVWFRDYFRLGEDTQVLQSLSYSFDFGVYEILTTVLFGGTLYQGSREELLNLTDYAEFIDLHGIDTIHTTPSFFNHVVSLGIKMPGLKIVHLGGEMLTANMVIELSKLVSPDCMIYNGYGPTEASVNSSIFALLARDAGELTSGGIQAIPIGKPSANNIIYILDEYNNLQPVEVAGELCVAGRGVSMGYLNRPELTAEKFLSISYKSYRTYISKKIYKTGDLARWLADGNIEFLGRMDQQVKIRGFRIEPGEIENRLLEMVIVKKAVVIDREINGEKYLCAYIVLVGGSDREPTAAAEELRKYLSLRLPNYMIPSYFMLLEKLPLTPTGKTDRSALPEPECVVETEYAPPGNEIEEQLTDIWSEILGIAHRPIGIYDNFFELGGHSLNAISMLSRIHKAFDIKVPLMEIFKYPTIRAMSEYINRVINNIDQHKQRELSKLVSLEKIDFDVEFNI